MPVQNAVASLLAGAFDYAGLYPPAGLDMVTAITNYHGYRQGTDAWALGRFVLPAARLAEFTKNARTALAGSPPAEPWRLAVTGGPELDADCAAIVAFHAEPANAAYRVDTYEVRRTTVEGISATLASLPAGITAYIEVPLDPDPAPLLDAIAARGARAKVRTGGIVAEAIPTPEAVARFIAGCAARQLPWKATAGLHHPVRAEHRLTYDIDAPRAVMFGFLNVMSAAALLAAGRTEQEAAVVLDQRTLDCPPDDRGALVSIGTCSFEEPLEDLRALGLL